MKKNGIAFISMFSIVFVLSGVIIAKNMITFPWEKDNTPSEIASYAPVTPPVTPVQDTQTASQNTTQEDTQTSSETEKKPEFTTVDRDYFDDALFIGDSRTEGLKEYSGLTNATYFADRGFTSFELDNRKAEVSGVGKVTIAELLDQKEFGKIYLMLGLNEVGYPGDQVVAQYGKVVQMIRSKQPDAVLYICANLHLNEKVMVDTYGSQMDPNVYSNKALDYINQGIEQYADGTDIFYLDVNSEMFNSNGEMEAKYTNDGVHVKSVYYTDWVDWLCTKAIEK